MELILFIIYFSWVNVGFLAYISWTEKHMFEYDTMFCRDVRASLGMIAYASDIEDTRKKINRRNSKF